MDADHPVISQFYREKVRPRFNQNFKIFLICLAIAVFVWFLKAFTKSYTLDLQYPLKYTELPQDKVVMTPLPRTLSVEVKAYGFDLLSAGGSGSDTLEINGQALKYETDQGRQYASFSTSRLYSALNRKLSSDISVNKILQDTLRFRLEDRIVKLLPVEPDVKVGLAAQHMLDGDIGISPSMVKVSGPRSVIDTLERLMTEFRQYENLDAPRQDYSRFRLPLDSTKITVQPEKALLEIPVVRFTEGQVDVPLSVMNVPDSLRVKLYPESVSLTFQVPLDRYESVQPALFTVAVDYEQLRQRASPLARVQFLDGPAFTRIVRITPEKVECILMP